MAAVDVTAREVEMYVRGFARGRARGAVDDAEKVAGVILEAMVVVAEGGSIRAVARKHGFGESSVRRWVMMVRCGVGRVAGK